MEKQTTQIKQPASVENTENAPLTVQETGEPLTKQQITPEPNQHTQSPAKRDVWESMSFGEKVSLLALGGLILAGVSYVYVSGKSVEYFITSLLAALALLIALGQYYTGKKQWLVVDEQADLMYHQLEAMKNANDRTREMIEQTERHFQITERPILVVEKVTAKLEPDAPIKPIIKIANRGRTAAKKLILHVNISVGPNHNFTTEGASIVHLPWVSANDYSRILNACPPPLVKCDEKTFNQVCGGHIFLYVFGEGTYEDLSGKTYPLERWGYVYMAERNKFVLSLDFDFAVEFLATADRIRNEKGNSENQ